MQSVVEDTIKKMSTENDILTKKSIDNETFEFLKIK